MPPGTSEGEGQRPAVAKGTGGLESDVAKYRQRLKGDPASLVFLPLAETLRKLGRLPEALEVCQSGLEHHPDYVSGQVVLAKIYSDLGNRDGARGILERIVEAVPDHLLANKLLAQIYLLIGEDVKARQRFATILMLNPTDDEAKKAMEVIDSRKTSTMAPPAAPVAEPATPPPAAPVTPLPAPAQEVEQREAPVRGPEPAPAALPDEVRAEGEAALAEAPILAEEVEEIDESVFRSLDAHREDSAAAGEAATEINTETLADLYLAQNLPEKAVKIYRELLIEEPGNDGVRRKLANALANLRVSGAEPEASPPAELVPDIIESGEAIEELSSSRDEAVTEKIIERLELWLATIKERRRGIQ